MFEFLTSLPSQAGELLSRGSVLIILVSGLVLAVPPFLLTRAHGWWGVALSVLAPLGLAMLLVPAAGVIRTFWPEQNLHAFGMLTVMFWSVLVFYLPSALIAAGLGFWRRGIRRARGPLRSEG